MIILRTPKGWTCPKEIDGHKLEGSWRAHQMPILDPKTNPAHLKLVEKWMRSYKPEELFDETGKLIAELRAMAPVGQRRITANPHANGGVLRKPMELPDFRDYAVKVKKPGQIAVSPTSVAGGVFARCDAEEHDELPRVRAGRDGFESIAGDL